MTHYVRKLKITRVDGVEMEVYAHAICTGGRDRRQQSRALRRAAFEWYTAAAWRYATTRRRNGERGHLMGRVADVSRDTATGVTSILKQTVARRLGIIIPRAEEPAWMGMLDEALLPKEKQA